jgi:hypothetical protein
VNLAYNQGMRMIGAKQTQLSKAPQKELKTMTKHKTISNSLIAAIAFLTVSVPSFAHAQSQSLVSQVSDETSARKADLNANIKRQITTPASSEVQRAQIRNGTRSASPVMLSASAFTAHNNFTTGGSSLFVSPQPTVSAGPIYSRARKQFRSADHDPNSRGSKLVTFVPSFGQKLPE